jgi:hypothetical protein
MSNAHSMGDFLDTLSPEALDALIAGIPSMPLKEKEILLQEIEDFEHKKKLRLCREDFLTFCAYVYPEWKEGPHHRYLRPILHKVKEGEETRIAVSMAPRFGKSQTIAYLFVAWYLGHKPNHHIIMVTHTAKLSEDFGRNVRNLIDTPQYKEIFPSTIVSKDKSAASNWTLSEGGKYLAVGIGANLAGHGAHLCLHPSTKIAGGTTIGAVAPGDHIITKKGFHKVTHKLLTTHNVSWILNDDLQASGKHPFYVNGRWVFAEDLQIGDRIETLTVWRNLWVKIRHLHSLLTKRGAA